ncbi:MAG: hypothetical protein CME67_00625 [Halobacteriovoraceae bacterium]|nr:hypothetical protein [Halobacteriovoraceae bacterium]|tara:strand:+ start:708 stop:1001 length:294 start_codon:yes stop_codon:yes gene_type:complete
MKKLLLYLTMLLPILSFAESIPSEKEPFFKVRSYREGNSEITIEEIKSGNAQIGKSLRMVLESRPLLNELVDQIQTEYPNLSKEEVLEYLILNIEID